VDTDDRSTSAELAAVLGPFVAWLATREPDELVRVRHRDLVEAYLRWVPGDRGGLGDRRRRYEARFAEPIRSRVHAALDAFAEHRATLAQRDARRDA
jgi:hypothetical protein